MTIDYREESTKRQGFILKAIARVLDFFGFHVIVHHGDAKATNVQFFVVSCKKLHDPNSPEITD